MGRVPPIRPSPNRWKKVTRSGPFSKAFFPYTGKYGILQDKEMLMSQQSEPVYTVNHASNPGVYRQNHSQRIEQYC